MMCSHDKITCFQRVERKGRRREIAERALSIFIFRTLCGQNIHRWPGKRRITCRLCSVFKHWNALVCLLASSSWCVHMEVDPESLLLSLRLIPCSPALCITSGCHLLLNVTKWKTLRFSAECWPWLQSVAFINYLGLNTFMNCEHHSAHVILVFSWNIP